MAGTMDFGRPGDSSSSVDPSDGAAAWRILIVDDVAGEAKICQAALETVYGYEVAIELYPLDALQKAREWRPDLIILDIAMPQMDGFELARRLKAEGCRASLMFLTSKKEQEAEVVGLKLADEYVRKSTSSRTFLARVDLVLRRRQSSAAASASLPVERSLSASHPIIDDATQSVRAPHGVDATLTRTELRLLKRLLEDVNKPVSYDSLLKAVWNLSDDRYSAHGVTSHPNRGIVNTNIARLRKKIERNPRQPELIVNAPRVGYTYILKPDPE